MNKFFIIMVLLFSAINSFAIEETLEGVENRGTIHNFIVTMPDNTPTAAVILFAGGHGKLDLDSSFGSISIGWGKSNNLVRTREDYAKAGFMVVTVDAPENKKKMNAIFRMSSKHALDIDKIISFIKEKADVPIWIIGTSMGTFSAANIAIELEDKIDGLVLTSSITKSKSKWSIHDDYPKGIIDMDLSLIKVPVLVISHEDDECKITPPSDIDELASSFTNSKKVEKLLFSGGDESSSNPCKSQSAHGFLGIEQKVVDSITMFIKEN